MTSNIRIGIAKAYYKLSLRDSIISNSESLDHLYKSPRSTISQTSLNRLASILTHAMSTVPYYRQLLGKQKAQEGNALDILAQFPVLTKNIIRQQGLNLLSESAGTKPRNNTSGGSTGEPVKLVQDLEMARECRTGEILFMKWAGHKLGEPHLLIWGVPVATFGQKVNWHERIFRFSQNETYLNCYRVTEQNYYDWTNAIKRIKPVLIEAYVDALHEFSKWIIENGINVVRPKGIITSAGVLTPSARDTISKAFGCPILNRYGSREVGNIACSCGHENALHIHEDWCHIEIVDENGNPCNVGEEGNVLVTLYSNKTMPLIRYQIEDRASWANGSCKCGRQTKRLSVVAGRMSDYVLAADGARINGTALTTLLYGVEGIKRFQYRQSSLSSLTLFIERELKVDAKKLEADLIDQTKKLEVLLRGTNVEVSYIEEIIPSNSGKYRYIINELSNQ